MMLDLWVRILLDSPRSRLLLKAPALADAPTRQRVLRQFELAGVDASRIGLLPRTKSWAEHLAFHDRIDIALDCFPYNGTTTTCDALWMGVPVVTLAGGAHVSRVGLSLLQAVGLGELAAGSPNEYVRIATSLAADPERVAELRRDLRQRCIESPLRDEARFTAGFELALRSAWRGFASQARAGR
jgi:protein O-GlcNAc transferase